MSKAKQKELDRLAEFGVYETLDIRVDLGKKRVQTRWELDHRKDEIRARFVARMFKKYEMMFAVFAPSTSPSISKRRITHSLQT